MDELVSVVIPTAGKRQGLLKACLESLTNQPQPHEVVAVVPPGRELSPEVRALCIVVQHPGSISAGLNAGIRNSRGAVIAITHDDCIPSQNWLREITAPLHSGRANACVGQTVPSRPGKAYPTTKVLDFAEPRFVSTSHFVPAWDLDLVGNNLALRRDTIEQVGYFHESLGIGSPLRGGEDLDMFHRILRAGLTICVNPHALVYHEPLETWQQEIRMMYTYRIGLAAYFWCHRAETDARAYFLRNVVVGQLRQLCRSLLTRRGEAITIESIALLGLISGLAKSWRYLP